MMVFVPRVLLILPSATYRAPEFLEAARALGAEVVSASNTAQALAEQMGDRFLELDLEDPDRAAKEIAALAERLPIDAVVGVDDQGLLTAALASELIGLPANPAAALRASRDKAVLRSLLGAAGVAQPRHAVIERDEHDVASRVLEAAATLGYPCVLKPSNLSASRGVIRVDDDASASTASARVLAILAAEGDGTSPLLLEKFVEGPEIAVEGLVREGALEVLAVFDKPDPLDGPYFEETIYVTPSRHDPVLLRASTALVQDACRAMGLVTGPVHAEVRLGAPAGPVLIEVAARTIGGRCATALSFARGTTLEQIVLAQALHLDGGATPGRLLGATGVMMLPIERSGQLVAVEGREDAMSVEHVTGLELSVPLGHRVDALPEGGRYLGFLFARAGTPQAVEGALRAAHAALEVRIEAVLPGEAA